MSTTDLTPDQLIARWVDHHETETTPAVSETLVQRVRREFAEHNWTIDGLPDDAAEQVAGILELLAEMEKVAA